MGFEKIKVANPIVEMDGETSLSISLFLYSPFPSPHVIADMVLYMLDLPAFPNSKIGACRFQSVLNVAAGSNRTKVAYLFSFLVMI